MGDGLCLRGEWCSDRVITISAGERTVTPAAATRAYCETCEKAIARWAGELPELRERLAALIGDPLQAEVQVRTPHGPQVILREDIDAHLRLLDLMAGSWAARVRAVKQLTPLLDVPFDSPEGVARNCQVLEMFPAVLFALQPAWMTRGFTFPPGKPGDPDIIPPDLEEDFADTEIIRAGVDFVDLPVLLGAADAGREIQWLHYRSRSLLLETNPPPELLIAPCRQCTWRTLRRAWADSERDLYSRCERCGDEMTADEYDINTRRWLAYHKALTGNLPVLGETPAPVLAEVAPDP